MARKIEVVEHNPEWVKMFKTEANAIERILGKNCATVHHIGSTAVEGLKAKPVIDILAVVRDLDKVDEVISLFEELEYEYKGENGIVGRKYFTKGGDNRTHHLHIYSCESKKEIERHIAVRDYLRAHKDEVNTYSELKVKLAEEFPCDSAGYCAGKAEYVSGLEKRAVEWYNAQNRKALFMSLGIFFGVAVGSVFGQLVFDNAGIGCCFGVAIGGAIGTALGSVTKK